MNAKKLISMLLALVLVLGLVITPAPVRAEQSADACIADLIGYYKSYQESAETDILRTLEALEEISARYGFHDKREAVAEALREAKLPIAYAMVDTIGEVWLMDLTEVLEEQGKS